MYRTCPSRPCEIRVGRGSVARYESQPLAVHVFRCPRGIGGRRPGGRRRGLAVGPPTLACGGYYQPAGRRVRGDVRENRGQRGNWGSRRIRSRFRSARGSFVQFVCGSRLGGLGHLRARPFATFTWTCATQRDRVRRKREGASKCYSNRTQLLHTAHGPCLAPGPGLRRAAHRSGRRASQGARGRRGERE